MIGYVVGRTVNYSTVCSVARPYPTLCDPMTVALKAPLEMGFSRQEYWSGLLFPSLVIIGPLKSGLFSQPRLLLLSLYLLTLCLSCISFLSEELTHSQLDYLHLVLDPYLCACP